MVYIYTNKTKSKYNLIYIYIWQKQTKQMLKEGEQKIKSSPMRHHGIFLQLPSPIILIIPSGWVWLPFWLTQPISLKLSNSTRRENSKRRPVLNIDILQLKYYSILIP